MIGDVVFVYGTGLYAFLIRMAQRFRRRDHAFSHVTHVGVVTGADEIIEARLSGVRLGTLSQYPHKDVVGIEATPAQRKSIEAYARSCVGHEYGLADAIGLSPADLADILSPD
ncbi:MAG: hypothetical protein LC754_10400 [Acidobacteria bacterium]|nr:hypothetical protein [Acidobacteriota bacterium]